MLIFICASCNKDGVNCSATSIKYSFEGMAVIYPQQETYNIGDTIFFSSQISTSIVDKITGQTIDYSNAVSLYGYNGINYIDTVLKKARPGLDSFSLAPVVGNFIDEPGNVNVRGGINMAYLETGSTYRFLGGFICRKKGIYFFGTGNLFSPGQQGQKCTKASFNMSLTNTDNNIPLYQYAINVTGEPEGMKRIYCFRVQ